MARIQVKRFYPATSGTMDNSVNAGDLIVVFMSWTATVAEPGVSDNLGTSYQLGYHNYAQSPSNNFTQQKVFYGFAGSSGVPTINVSTGYSDMGFTVGMYNGIGAANLIMTYGGNRGPSSPLYVTLFGYMDGLLVAYYANESTPIATPGAYGATGIDYDSAHASYYEDYVGLPANQNYNIGITTSSTYNNENLVAISFGHFVQPTLSHSTDANKRKATLRTHTTDSFKHIKATRSHTTDANKRKTFTRSHSTDAYLGHSKHHTTDALKRTQTKKIHSTDALKKFVISKIHKTDAMLHWKVLKSHTTDAVKHVRGTRSHSTDARKTRLTGTPPVPKTAKKFVGQFRRRSNDKPRIRR